VRWMLGLAALLWSPRLLANSCASWGQPTLLGSLLERTVHESSGLARSLTRPGVWYTHNDSGTGPEIYAFRLDGTFLGTSQIRGAGSEDWEDMAAGPCPAEPERSCIYIGDIGDNDKERLRVQIHAIPEPEPGEAVDVLATWNLRYPDEAFNAEALLVHPQSGEISLVTKSKKGKSRVFGVPSSPGTEVQEMTLLARVQVEGDHSNLRKITGGDWSPDGRHIVLRSYVMAMLWEVDPVAPQAHWSLPPEQIFVGLTQQGESISFDGPQTLLITSEGSPMPIISTRCLDWR
jgi:hypothetical protein